MRWFPMIVLFLVGCVTRPAVNEVSFTRDWDTWAIDDRPVSESDTIVVEVPAFTVTVMPLDELNELWDELEPGSKFDVWGFAVPSERALYVPWAKYRWDVDGFPVVDLETLGHEVWHLPELGGDWHE